MHPPGRHHPFGLFLADAKQGRTCRKTPDKEVARRRESAKEAARESRQLAVKLRRRVAEADGSDQRAREEYREFVRSTI